MNRIHGLPVRSEFDGLVEPCRSCRGAGSVRRSWTLRDLWFRVRGEITCPDCHGIGFSAVPCSAETPTAEFPFVACD